MLSSILLFAVLASLGGTVVMLTVVVLKHRHRASKTEKVMQDQTALIISTIADSQAVFKELHDAIDDIERLARGTTASAAIRAKADEMRDMVIGLDDLILVQNIEEGLRIREQFRSSGHNEQ